jgi:hypothetical protein
MPMDSHQRAAEMHDLAAHAHRVAALHHGHEDHLTAHENSRKAMEHSAKAFKSSQDAHQESANVARQTGNNGRPGSPSASQAAAIREEIESDELTLASVKKEMDEPRMATSVRLEDAAQRNHTKVQKARAKGQS